jgi:peptide/nickel transport system permease protein
VIDTVQRGGRLRRQRLRHSAAGWLAVGWLGAVTLGAAVGSALPLPNPNDSTGAPYQPPSGRHPLGSDDLGRDELARLLAGGQVSLTVGVAAAAIALTGGLAVGLLAGYRRGRLDALIRLVVDSMLSFPPLIVFLTVVAFVGPGVGTVAAAIGVLSIAPMARVIRAATISVVAKDFILAAQASGTRPWRLMVREILPNVLDTAVAFAIVGVGLAILAEGSLSFFGLSVPPPRATWGGMIDESRMSLETDPQLLLWPALFIFVTVLSLNVLSDLVATRSRS